MKSIHADLTYDPRCAAWSSKLDKLICCQKIFVSDIWEFVSDDIQDIFVVCQLTQHLHGYCVVEVLPTQSHGILRWYNFAAWQFRYGLYSNLITVPYWDEVEPHSCHFNDAPDML